MAKFGKKPKQDEKAKAGKEEEVPVKGGKKLPPWLAAKPGKAKGKK